MAMAASTASQGQVPWTRSPCTLINRTPIASCDRLPTSFKCGGTDDLHAHVDIHTYNMKLVHCCNMQSLLGATVELLSEAMGTAISTMV